MLRSRRVCRPRIDSRHFANRALPVAVVFVLNCAVLASEARAEAPLMLRRTGISDLTTLVLDGRPNAVIVYPEGREAYAPLVAKIQEAIENATGAKLPARGDSEVLVSRLLIDPAFKRQNLILLGNLSTNRAMVQLGGNFFLYSTPRWPGENGFELRTVTNPFGTRSNCVVLGGSDPAGVAAAANRFLEVLAARAGPRDALTVPRQLQIIIGGRDQAALAAEPLRYRENEMAGTYRLAAAIEAFNRTGSTAQLKVVRGLVNVFLAEDRAPAVSDYGTESAVRAIDLIDTFVLSDEENLEMDNLLLKWVLRVIDEKPFWNPQGRKWSFGVHQACGSLAFYAVTNYLLKNGTPNDPARRLLEHHGAASRAFLHFLCSSFKDEKKDVGWETWMGLTVPPRYALAEGDATYFESGTALDVIRRTFYADRGFGPAALAAFFFNDGRFRTLAPAGGTLGGWAFVMNGPQWLPPPEIVPAAPDFLIGTKVMHASPTDWKYAHRGEAGPSSWHTPLPYDRTFHLLGFAGGVDQKDTLTVLGGWDSIGVPGEANSIRMFRHGGHRFLSRADGNDPRKPRPGRFYQNSVVVESGRYETAPPCAAELLLHHDGKTVGMSASRLSDYHGVDWTRRVFWRRGRYFAVIDSCRVKKEGPITIVNQWWNGDAPAVRGNRWISRAEQQTFYLVMADPGLVDSRRWWAGGPYQLRQSKHLDASAGQVVTHLNLFYVDRPGARQQYAVQQLAPGIMLVHGSVGEAAERRDELALIGCSDGRRPVELGNLRIQAEQFFISPSTVVLRPEHRFSLKGEPVFPADNGSTTPDDQNRLRIELLRLRKQKFVHPVSPHVPAEPRRATALLALSPRRNIGLETGFRPVAGVAFAKHDDGTVTWDLGRPVKISLIEGIRVADDTVNVRCSFDHFAQDDRSATASKGVREDWVYYQYGFAASLGIQTVGPLNVVARYFRIEPPGSVTGYGRWILGSWHGQPWNIKAHNPELFDRGFWQDVIFRSDHPEVRFTRSVVADLDGDRSEEVVIATDRNELIVLGTDAAPRWKRRFDAPVLALICEDLDDDGRREVICSTHDHAVHALDDRGQSRFRIDILAEAGRKSGANALTLYTGAAGQVELAASTYHQLRRYDGVGNLLEVKDPMPGMYLDSMPPVAIDLTGDGQDDFAMRDNVSGHVSVVDGRTRSPVASFSTHHTGRGLALRTWRMRGSGRPRHLLSIAESGISMLEVTGAAGTSTGGDATLIGGGLRPVFSLPIGPIAAWSVNDLDDDGTAEILLATRYGAVLVLNEQGRIASSTVTSTDAYDFVVLRGASGAARIVVATGDGLRPYDAGLRPVGNVLRGTAGCRLMETVSVGRGQQALCLFDDGRAAVLRLLDGDE